MSLTGISTKSIVEYLRKERGVYIQYEDKESVLSYFEYYGLIPTEEQAQELVKSIQDIEFDVRQYIIDYINVNHCFYCDIKYKEDGSKVETVRFCDLKFDITKMKTNELSKEIFYYMTKQEAEKLLGVEDNGLDFYITKVY